MPLKHCPKCNKSNGPRSFFCSRCQQPFEKTLAKAKHLYVPLAAPIPHIATQPRYQSVPICNTTGPTSPTLKPNAFAGSLGTLNLDPGHEFDDLLGKTDALNILMASLAVYNQTKGRNRYHSVLVGGPSAGKSEIINRIVNVVGSDNVLRINSESASKAGMENEILSHPTELPAILAIEEIEKCNPDALLWLLSALDTRQEIIKVTARDGILRRKVPFVCVSTCNDLAKLERMHSGSIASRFTNKLHIPDMTDSMRREIFKLKIRAVPHSNEAWIDPAIDYCRSIGDLSMRKIESVLMCGQDRLLTGEYQRSLGATQKI